MKTIINLLNKLVVLALSVLPNSPFQSIIGSITNIPYLNYLNYFVPVSTYVQIMAAWTGAIALYYIVSAILRWAGAIE